MYNSDNLQPIEINEENIGYFQTNTCEFNLFQVISKNLRNTSFELRSDPTSRVECHGKVNGLDLVDNKLKIYFGTNLNIDIIVQSFFWIFCLSLIPKNKSNFVFKINTYQIIIILLLFYIHLIGENKFYNIFSEEFDTSIYKDNYFLLSLFSGLLLILLILSSVIKNRTENLINYLPFLSVVIGAFNSFNLNFFIFVFVYFGIEAIFNKSFNSKILFFYLLISTIVLSSSQFNDLLFDVDKIKGFASSSPSFESKIFWFIIFYLLVLGFFFLFELTKKTIDFNLIKKNFLISGVLLTVLGLISSVSPYMNYLTYYYLGLNKFGMQSITSIQGNTWRGLSSSAEAVGEFYSFIFLFVFLTFYIHKIQLKKTDFIYLLIILYGLIRSNNFAAITSLILIVSLCIVLKALKTDFRKKIISAFVLIVCLIALLFSTTPYSSKYLSKAMLYHGIANTQFSYELPQNQFGETLIEQMSFGEILLLDQEESGVSNTLYYMLNIYNDDGDIKNLPNPVTVISAISVPINRSEKWGIFIAKYNPSLTELLFGYGPNQLSEYYLSHPTKINTGLVLPHSSLLSFLIFFGLFGILFIFSFFLTLLKKNYSNHFFLYLFIFMILNLIKSDSILYLSSFVLFLFTICIARVDHYNYEE